MKLNKSTYFAFFFLFCFLASFSANTYKNLNTVASKLELNSTKFVSISSKEVNNNSLNDFLLEENEAETETVFLAQVFTLPYFVTYFQYELLQQKLISEKPLTEKLTNPIYITVCNFRI